MRRALVLVAVLGVAPAFADDDPYRAQPPSPDERVWRTPYTLDIPTDLTPRRERDVNIMVDPSQQDQQQANPGQPSPQQHQPRPVILYRTGRGR